MLRLTAGVLLLSLVAGSKCLDQQRCGDEQTCCQIHSGEFNCCPFHQGECCEDHLHCCPEGMLCEVKASRCTNATHSIPWAERFPSEHSGLVKSFRMISSSAANNIYDAVCPDNSFCPSEFSCLKVSDTYGCCPVAQGIVCSDGKHCCPKDQECTADSASCVKKTEPVLAVLCADGISECPVETSCCETADGGWGCCPTPRAVCCDDGVHCCPEDSVCDVNNAKCVSSTKHEIPMWAKFPARQRAAWEDRKFSDVPCDDTSSCPDETTCCKTEQGEWSCCPLPQAVCCEDFIHCCPHGKKCNLAAQKCEGPSGSVPWLKKEPSRPIQDKNVPEDSVVPCNETVACADGTTCCKTQEGGWSCCPLPQAVCCEDFIHCCPNGKKCNLVAQSCDDSSGSVPWLKKEPTRPIGDKNVPDTKVSDVPCDDTSSCPDETTCCKTEQGEWSCCPLPQAVCCEDFIHCCPHGTKCNLAAQSCDDPSGSVPWLKKEPSRPTAKATQNTSANAVSVKCDPHMSCPDHTTCCFMQKSQKWGCCPLDQATCCADGENCCPKGYTCRDQRCVKSSWIKFDSVPFASVRDTAMPQIHTDIDCGGGFSCKDTETCCRMSASSWGCCPSPKAVCCSDMLHCCPAGYTCDESGSCNPAMGFYPDVFFSGKKRARAV